LVLVDILLVVLIIVATALCIALIYYIWKISNAVNAMQEDINELSKNLNPLIICVNEISDNLKEITGNAKAHVDISKNVVLSIKDRVDTILNFEDKVRRGIEGPVMLFIREITALNNGLNTFLSYFRKKNS
jgi:hypothetical protein